MPLISKTNKLNWLCYVYDKAETKRARLIVRVREKREIGRELALREALRN